MKSTSADSPGQVFGEFLKRCRARSGLSSEQVGARVHMSGSQIRKIEAGDRTPTRDLVEAIEAIPELACNGSLMELFDIVEDRLGQNGAYPGWFEDWVRQEAAARRLRSFEVVVVPGLLQTEEYARAVLSTRVGQTDEKLDKAVDARMDRQTILYRDNPAELWAIVDEAVLRRTVGSAETMRKQLEHLADAARRPNIVIQAIPLEGGAHQGLNGGAFVLADFSEAASIAYQDTALAGQIIDKAAEVEALAITWDTLRLEALPRAASLTLIEEAARTWT